MNDHRRTKASREDSAPAGGREQERAGDAENEGRRERDDAGDSDVAPEGGAPAALPVAPEIDYRDRWLRSEAELQNFRRRAQRDLEEACRTAEDRFLRDMIEVLDDLELGIDSARKTGADEAWIKGMELVAGRMRDILARAGVTPMEPIGEPFDPRVHEAMLEMHAEGRAPGEVAHVIRRGYMRGDRPLRPARVGVTRTTDE